MELSCLHATGCGAYILVLRLKRVLHTEVGRLGAFTFKQGTYAYVGSAKRSMKARVDRHIRVAEDKSIKPHWHIDYLLIKREVSVHEVYLFPELDECILAKEVSKLKGATSPVRGFGASDCKKRCHSHFFKMDDETEIGKLDHPAIKIVARAVAKSR